MSVPVFIAQIGLYIGSVIAMYLAYGLPVFAVIAAVVAVAGGERTGPGEGFRWSDALFRRTFRVLALAGGAVVLAACVWASRNIGAR